MVIFTYIINHRSIEGVYTAFWDLWMHLYFLRPNDLPHVKLSYNRWLRDRAGNRHIFMCESYRLLLNFLDNERILWDAKFFRKTKNTTGITSFHNRTSGSTPHVFWVTMVKSAISKRISLFTCLFYVLRQICDYCVKRNATATTDEINFIPKTVYEGTSNNIWTFHLYFQNKYPRMWSYTVIAGVLYWR